jgi:translation initiation factor IF-2
MYRVIYDALNDLEAAMKGMLDPEYKEVILGHAEVRSLFKVSSVGTICGSYITDGKITRNSKVRLLRENVVIYEGEIDTLKRFKDDAKEVASGFECGILLNKYNDVRESDVIEAFVMEAIPRK